MAWKRFFIQTTGHDTLTVFFLGDETNSGAISMHVKPVAAPQNSASKYANQRKFQSQMNTLLRIESSVDDIDG